MIQKAKRGNKGALIALYEANKDKAYYIALGLLKDRAAAGNAVVWAFQDVISLLDSAADEAAFSELIEKRVIKHCRKKMESKSKNQQYPPFDAARAEQLVAEFSGQPAALPEGTERSILNSIAVGVKAKKSTAKPIPGWVFGVLAVVAAVAVAVVIVLFGGQKNETASTGDVSSQLYTAAIEIEDYGTVTLELDGETAPITVENFVSLAKSGFYDGLTFHRIMEGFMMQGGDPEGTGGGGSEQNIVGEFSNNGYENNISHKRGVVSMARRGDSYDSASSQFFIVHEDSTFLDGEYAAFGHVTSGMEIVDEICKKFGPDDGVVPADEQPVIKTITIK